MASPTQQKKKDFTDIRDLAKDVVALEKAFGNEIKYNSSLIKRMASEKQKILNMDVKRQDAGKAYLKTADLIGLANMTAHNAVRAVTEETLKNAATLSTVESAHAEVAQLADEVSTSFKEQVSYADELLEISSELETMKSQELMDNTELEEINKEIRDAGFAKLDLQKQIDAAGAAGNKEQMWQLLLKQKDLAATAEAGAADLKVRKDAAKAAVLENSLRRDHLEYAQGEMEKASKSKDALLKKKELQEGMNELFGVSIKDVEKYGKKFQQFVNNPALIAMGVFAGLAAITKKFLISPIQDSMKLQSELGIGAGHAWDLTLASKEAAAGGFMYGESVSESLERAKTLVDTWGVLNDETMRSIKIATDLERTYGISTDSAAGLAQMMEATSDSTKDVLMAGMAGEMKSMQDAGLPVGSIMTDIAGDTDFFAGHMKDGGKNIMKAAKFAKKLGMDMNTISSAAESLLDWESSINAEMEASVLLGREVNMEQARQLMFEGKHEEAMKAIMQQVGSEADFAAMNVVQREALAAASGLSLTDLTKMVAAEQKLASMSVTERKANEKRNKISVKLQKIFGGVVDMFREWYGRLMIPIYEKFQQVFDTGLGVSGIITGIKESMEKIIVSVIKWVQALDLPKIKAMAQSVWDMVVGAKDLAKWLWEHKTILIAMGTMWALNKMGLMSFILEGTKGLIKMIAKMWALKAAKTAVETPAPTAAAGGLTSFMGNPMGLVKAAGAMLIIAAAVWVFAKALQEFNTVDWASLPKAALALVTLTAAMFGLGLLLSGPGALIFGAGVLGFIALGGALIILGLGLMSIGKGAKIVSELTVPLTSLVSIVGKIGLLAIGFAALGASLGALAIGAMLLYPALPALAALSALGIMPAGATINNRTERNARERTTQVEKEIKATNKKLDGVIELLSKLPTTDAVKAISKQEISATERAFGNN